MVWVNCWRPWDGLGFFFIRGVAELFLSPLMLPFFEAPEHRNEAVVLPAGERDFELGVILCSQCGCFYCRSAFALSLGICIGDLPDVTA